MLSEWAEQAVMQSALRFDGWAWVESVRPGQGTDLRWLTEPLVSNLTLHRKLEENLAVFFGLQRFLWKWGGEQLPENHLTRLAYYLLFLKLHQLKIPAKFKCNPGTVSFTTDPTKSSLEVADAVEAYVRDVWPMLAHDLFDANRPWSKLPRAKIGRYGEYFAKLELTRLGGEVYTSEVDDRGVDFILRNDAGQFFAVQVKTIRSFQAVSLAKKNFRSSLNSWLVLVVLTDGQSPQPYLVPALAWEREDDKYFASSPDGSEWKLHFDSVSKATLASKYAMTHLPMIGP